MTKTRIRALISLAVIIITVIYLFLVIDWLVKPVEVFDADNIRQEYEWFYSQQNGLLARRANIAIVERQQTDIVELYGPDTGTWPMARRDQYQQLSQAQTQQVMAYNLHCAEYQARWENVFHNVVAPRNIPRDCELIQ